MKSVKNRRLSIFGVMSSRFPDTVASGAESVLSNLLAEFSAVQDLKVDVYHQDPFPERRPSRRVAPNVFLRPIQAPLAIDSGSKYVNLSRAARFMADLRDIASRSDAVYLHGSGGMNSYLAQSYLNESCQRLITSIHDLAYEEGLISALESMQSETVAVSRYLAACLGDMVERIGYGRDIKIHVIPNGYSMRAYSGVESHDLRHSLKIPDDRILLLHPHRPDESGKGLEMSLKALGAAREMMPRSVFSRVRLLVPLYQARGKREHDESAQVSESGVQRINDLAMGHGVRDSLIAHRWIPYRQMPNYLAMGHATLCVGDFPESFGNIHVESILAGTPPIVSRVGAQRTTFPDEMLRKVDPEDANGIADQICEIVGRRERVGKEAQDYVTRHYSTKSMARAYLAALVGDGSSGEALVVPGASSRSASRAHRARLRMPAWCAQLSSGYWNDYSGYVRSKTFLAALPRIVGKTADEAVAAHVARDDIRRWIRQGHLSESRSELWHLEGQPAGCIG